MNQNVVDVVAWAVFRAVHETVNRAMAVSDAVSEAGKEDPKYPALQDFMRAVGWVH